MKTTRNSDREWFGRAGGLFLLAGSIWLIVMTLVFVGAQWTAQLWAWFGSVIGPAGGISGVIAAIVGKSSLTSASGSAKGDKPPSYKKLISDAAFSLAAVVFAAFLVILSAASIDQILFQQSFFQAAAFGNAVPKPAMRHCRSRRFRCLSASPWLRLSA